MDDIYHRLRERMDDFSTGYPKTDSGVEIRILKKLFAEEEADLFIQLTPMFESAEDVAKRLGREMEQTVELLNRMTQKGHLYSYKQDNTVFFAPTPYVIGIFDFQVIDRELAVAMDEYFDTALNRTLYSVNNPELRTIPINKQLVNDCPISPYDDALKMIENHNVFAVIPCPCRTWRKLADKGCEKPVETCMQMGFSAEHVVGLGIGRFISKENAKLLIKKSDEAGLVLQSGNNQEVGNICSCCGDCCAFLRALKKQPVPSAVVKSNYFAVVDIDKCTDCETCLERCQMEAITFDNDMKSINLDRCIGCGLCVTTCEVNAMSLSKKAEDELYEPPRSSTETLVRIAQERGKI